MALHGELQTVVERVLFDAEQLRGRVEELGAEISADYSGRQIHLVVVLRGAAIFAADLIRALTVPASIDFIAISSYAGSSKSTGAVRILKDLEDDIAGRHVLIVEDIIDSGLTLTCLTEMLQQRGVASLEVCALLDKPSARRTTVTARYIGFRVPDCFVVGYGLDLGQQYRGLSCIAEVPSPK